MEFPSPDQNVCKTKIIVIEKGSLGYIGCGGDPATGPCRWVVMERGSNSNSESWFRNISSSGISCRDWTPDPSVFETPGTACPY